jgi:hypothetical protein
MKYKLQIIFFFIMPLMLIGKNNYEITPVVINFKGVEASDNAVVAYSDYGSVFTSYDNGKTWNQNKVFDQGDIINVFLENDRITAFSIDGNFSVSTDRGITWKSQNNINDSISYVIKYNEGYFLSCKSGIIQLNNDFKIINTKSLDNSSFKFFKNNYNSDFGDVFFRKNLIYFKGNLFFLNDTNSTIYKFDSYLNQIDRIDLKQLVPSRNYYTNYSFCADSQKVYIKLADSVYQTQDFKSFDYLFKYNISKQIFGDSSLPVLHKVINNKLYCITQFYNYLPISGPYFSLYEINGKNSAIKVGNINCSLPPTEGGLKPFQLFLNDFHFVNNQIIVVSNKKFINSKNFTVDKENRICERLEFTSRMPDIINDKTFLIDNYDNQLYSSKNSGLTFQRENGDSVFFKQKNYFYRKIQNFFNQENKLVYGGEFLLDSIKSTIAISNDLGKTFQFRKVPNINFSLQSSNLQLNDENFVLAQNLGYGKSWKTWIKKFNNNFDSLFTITDSLFNINYIYFKNPDYYFVIASNPDSSSELKFQSNNFSKWTNLKKYDSYIDSLFMPNGTYLTSYITKELWNWKEFVYKSKKYLSLVSFKKSDFIFRVELLDLSNNSIIEIYHSKFINYKTKLNYGLDFYNDTLYLNVNDSLFVFSNFNDKLTKYYYLLPNNGIIANGNFKKMDDKIFAFYFDSLNSLNYYFLKFNNLDSLTLDVKQEIEIESSYLFTYPPFPIPAINFIKSLIYWDNSSEIEIDGIFDLYGNKIDHENKAFIDKINTYSGYVIWICSNVPDGIYFVKIKHGNDIKYIKVLINRVRK